MSNIGAMWAKTRQAKQHFSPIKDPYISAWPCMEHDGCATAVQHDKGIDRVQHAPLCAALYRSRFSAEVKHYTRELIMALKLHL